MAAAQLAAQAYHPGTSRNHTQQAATFIKFCDHYHFPFINPSIDTIDTLSCYITHLTQHFRSPASVCNYLSGVRFIHKQLGLSPTSLHSFPVTSLLRGASITMRTPPLRLLPILPQLLHQLCTLSSSLGALGPSMWVCLTLGFFGMLRQSNLAPPSRGQFDPSRHTCRADVIQAPPQAFTLSYAGQKLTSRRAQPQYYPFP